MAEQVKPIEKLLRAAFEELLAELLNGLKDKSDESKLISQVEKKVQEAQATMNKVQMLTQTEALFNNDQQTALELQSRLYNILIDIKTLVHSVILSLTANISEKQPIFPDTSLVGA